MDMLSSKDFRSYADITAVTRHQFGSSPGTSVCTSGASAAAGEVGLVPSPPGHQQHQPAAALFMAVGRLFIRLDSGRRLASSLSLAPGRSPAAPRHLSHPGDRLREGHTRGLALAGAA